MIKVPKIKFIESFITTAVLENPTINKINPTNIYPYKSQSRMAKLVKLKLPPKILYIKFYKRFIHLHFTDIEGRLLFHLLPSTIHKFLNIKYLSLKKKQLLKKYKKHVSFYVQMFRIVKSILYTFSNPIFIRQSGSNKFTRKLLHILVKKATPVTELDVPENEIDHKFSQFYLLNNIVSYTLWGYKSYTTIKTKKKKSIKRKLYKRIYIKNYRFM